MKLNVYDASGKLVPEAKDLADRGVWLDTAHGRLNFGFDVGRRVLDQGLMPHCISTDLTVPGHPEISVIGDAAKLDGRDGKLLPGLATVAIQQGRHVADGIRRGQPGASTPFKYFDKGALAVVGRGRAVCEIRGRRLSGLIAFLTS